MKYIKSFVFFELLTTHKCEPYNWGIVLGWELLAHSCHFSLTVALEERSRDGQYYPFGVNLSGLIHTQCC